VIGTRGERVGLTIVARHGQAWNMANGTPDEFATKSARLDGYCTEIGRDPAEIERAIMVARAREFIAAGATHLIFSAPVPYSAAGVRRIWDEVITPLRR
jgi:alkanesulfonate monooxygenase SsuD/methylene tetrahydromethanopterin reductase-like flavin-dependent oxidoreductase (luciferase family)